ncbi:MAG: hypothetical protein ACRD0W_21560 [Acidimicrobiales bacterium]
MTPICPFCHKRFVEWFAYELHRQDRLITCEMSGPGHPRTRTAATGIRAQGAAR